eukprot:g3387.t1
MQNDAKKAMLEGRCFTYNVPPGPLGLSLIEFERGAIVRKIFDEGHFRKMTHLRGCVLYAIDGQKVFNLSLKVIVHTLAVLRKEPKIITFCAPPGHNFPSDAEGAGKDDGGELDDKKKTTPSNNAGDGGLVAGNDIATSSVGRSSPSSSPSIDKEPSGARTGRTSVGITFVDSGELKVRSRDAKSGDMGFICPECMAILTTPELLVSHQKECRPAIEGSTATTIHVMEDKRHVEAETWRDVASKASKAFRDAFAIKWTKSAELARSQRKSSVNSSVSTSDSPVIYKATVKAMRLAMGVIPVPKSIDDKAAVLECVERLRNLSTHFSIPRFALPSGVTIRKCRLGWATVVAELYQTDDVASMADKEETFISTHPDVRTVLYMHGGGYALMSPATHRHFLAHLTLRNMQIVAIDYRKPPSNPYPAAVADVVKAFRFLVNRGGKKRGLKPDRIIFAGDSAGGGLCVSAMVALRDMGCPLPAAGVLLSPWLDLDDVSRQSWIRNRDHDFLTPSLTRVFAQVYSGRHSLDAPGVSPINANISGLPPLLMEVGDREVFKGMALEFQRRAREQSVDVTCEIRGGMVHAFTLWANVFETSLVSFESACGFIDKHVPRATDVL